MCTLPWGDSVTKQTVARYLPILTQQDSVRDLVMNKRAFRKEPVETQALIVDNETLYDDGVTNLPIASSVRFATVLYAIVYR